jgi:hypothetical protein
MEQKGKDDMGVVELDDEDMEDPKEYLVRAHFLDIINPQLDHVQYSPIKDPRKHQIMGSLLRMQSSDEKRSIVLASEKLQRCSILEWVDIILSREVDSLWSFECVLLYQLRASLSQEKMLAYKVLHGDSDFLAGVLTSDKDGSLFILDNLRFSLFERSLDTRIFWFSASQSLISLPDTIPEGPTSS